MAPTLTVLAVAGMFAAAQPGFTVAPPTRHALAELAGPTCTPAAPGLAPGRLALAGAPDETSRALRFVAGLGASLAWDLADLPRHRARLPEPIGGFVPGAAFRAHLARGAAGPGGAIEALAMRWDALYPPYALAGPEGP